MLGPARDVIERPEESDVDIGRIYGELTPLEISARLAEVQFRLLFATRAMCRRSYEDPAYWRSRAHLDRAALLVHRAKWLTGRATGFMIGVESPSHADGDVAAGLAAADEAGRLADEVLAALESNQDLPALAPLALQNSGAETPSADGIPVLPSICPVILLRGSSYEMGRQYAKQAIQIFGAFVFARYAAQRFTKGEYESLRRWEAELASHAPELLEMVRGWADGATEAGVPMRYENVLVLWTTDLEPARRAEAMMDSSSALFAAAYAGVSAQKSAVTTSLVEDATDLCSGACAWGAATKSGRPVVAASTDHDCWFQATIVAYPDTGNPFIFTPFSVTGWLPGLGNTTMAGMPGVNAKGLVLVHHGGDPKMVESPASWGWGIRKGAAIFHILRFAGSAEEARALERSWPIADVGRMMGAPGAMWADGSGGYVADSREPTAEHPGGLMRTHTVDAAGKPHDFLYVTNNALHPAARRSNGGGDAGLDWSLEGGWHTLDPATIAAGDTTQDCFARWASKHSAARNRFFAARLFDGEGQIDLDWMVRLYRSPGEYPLPDEWEARMARYRSGGELACSPAHRGNAFTVAIDPSADGGATYMGCIGPARRDLPPRDNSHGFHYFDETNAFWTLRLSATPEALVTAACADARIRLERAKALRHGSTQNAAAAAVDAWIAAAAEEIERAHAMATRADGTATDALAKALRGYTRAQVRAQQAIDVFERPCGLGESAPAALGGRVSA